MKQYLELGKHILENGNEKEDRTGTGTLSTFGYQMRFNLQEGFPLLTTKDLGGIRLKGIIEELLWFLSGDTNVKTLADKGVNIWNRDAYRDFKRRHPNENVTYKEFVERIKAHDWGYDLGPIYGSQWINWHDHTDYNLPGINQIANVLKSLKEVPDSRRHIVSAWNVAELKHMALPPCHVLFQFYVHDDTLSCQLYQRSADYFLGVPYNIASYSLLVMMMAQVLGYKPGEFIHTLGDTHIYLNHVEQVKLQLTREPRKLPTMKLNPEVSDLFEFTYEDFELVGYDPYPSIKGAQSF